MPNNPLNRRSFLTIAAATPALLKAATLEQVRLGVTSDEIDEDVAVAAEFLQSFGLGYAEVRSIWGKYNTSQPLEKVKEARQILDAHKVRTSVLGTAFFRGAVPTEGAALDAQWKLLDDAFARAEILGTNKLRTFGFMKAKGETVTDKTFSRIYELETEAARRAKKRGMRLAVENLVGSYFETGADSAKLLKNVKEEAFGLTWDPNNAGMAGEVAYPDGYAKLDPHRIFHVHLRDWKKGPDGKVVWTFVGEGTFDNLHQIRALLKSGYKENFTLETHAKHPDGKAAATRKSLTALLQVIKEV
ncbi:MAG TPA: sugar phosphate isomerase/epimerase family protein [Bryobacteraceae bacterium]|jgi:sugar phosphate isomerase/epimerase